MLSGKQVIKEVVEALDQAGHQITHVYDGGTKYSVSSFNQVWEVCSSVEQAVLHTNHNLVVVVHPYESSSGVVVNYSWDLDSIVGPVLDRVSGYLSA